MLKLKQILEEKKMSQKKLAAILGVSTVSMSSWAKNKSMPSLKMAIKICKALKITLNDLIEH